jgi:hypothetical protein
MISFNRSMNIAGVAGISVVNLWGMVCAGHGEIWGLLVFYLDQHLLEIHVLIRSQPDAGISLWLGNFLHDANLDVQLHSTGISFPMLER